MTNDVGFTFSVGDATQRFTLLLSKTITIDDTYYLIWCTIAHTNMAILRRTLYIQGSRPRT
jgi:hypothetical protein